MSDEATQAPTQGTAELDARPLSTIIDSPRSVKALADAGFTCLGDVRQQGLRAIQDIRYVGPATVEDIIIALGPSLPAEPAEEEGEIEEGTHPLRLASPYGGYSIKLLDADRVDRPGGGYSVYKPLYIQFVEGEGKLPKATYLKVCFHRDAERIAAAMNDERFRWRRAAAAFLADIAGYGRDFHVRSD